MPTALVTGATGFLGGHLVRTLVDRGIAVRALYRDGRALNKLKELPIELRQGDVTRPETLAAAMDGKLDYVFHCAASTASWRPYFAEQMRINVEGTRNVVEAALNAGVGRLIHTSSVAVYGFTEQVISEDSPHLGRDSWVNYTRSKALGEDEVHAGIKRGLNAVICNPTHILGPGDTHTWAKLFLLVDQRKLPGVPPGSGAFVDVRLAAKAHLAAAERGQSGENYLLGGAEASFLELVHTIGHQLGRATPRRSIPAPVLRSLARFSDAFSRITKKEPDITPEAVAFVCHHMHCDIGKAQRELDLTVTPLYHLVADTIGWLREQNLVSQA